MASVVGGVAAISDSKITNNCKLRIFFVPIFINSHIINMTHLAALAARRPGVESTMVLTPANAALVRPTVDRSVARGSPVKLMIYPFPAEEAGLLPGQENIGSVPYSEARKVYEAADLCRDRISRILREHRPDVIVADMTIWWTTVVAAELGIPHITHHSAGCFPQCVITTLLRHDEENMEKGINNMDQTELVKVPDFPEPEIKIPRSELPEFLRSRGEFARSWGKLCEVQMMMSYGAVLNTFRELEPAYCDRYATTSCQRAWYVGPVQDQDDSDDEEAAAECFKWLNQQKEGSVVYVCLGSWCAFDEDQTREMALGLESSAVPFLWALREETAYLPEGWEERTRSSNKGMVLKGWAPQVAILGHSSVGAFLTHCGWNSVLEAASAGVPVLTWPFEFDQFLNERLMVDVAGIGERVFDGVRSSRLEERVVVPREAIGSAIARFMEEGKHGKLRERAKEYGEMAKAAVREGGSSYKDLNRMLDDLMEFTENRKKKEIGNDLNGGEHATID